MTGDPIHWRARLVVELDVYGPGPADDIAGFAAQSVAGKRVGLDDAECRVFVVASDGTETGPFYRTSAYRAALAAEVAGAGHIGDVPLLASEPIHNPKAGR